MSDVVWKCPRCGTPLPQVLIGGTGRAYLDECPACNYGPCCCRCDEQAKRNAVAATIVAEAQATSLPDDLCPMPDQVCSLQGEPFRWVGRWKPIATIVGGEETKEGLVIFFMPGWLPT